MRLLIIVFISIISSSCIFQRTLTNDKLVQKNFSSEEIIELEKIHDLVFDQICPNSKGNKSYSLCWEKYSKYALPIVGENAGKNEPYVIPDLSLEKTYDFFDSLDSIELNLIWETTEDIFREGIKGQDEPWDTIQYFSVNRESKYITFIYELKDSQNELYSEFVKRKHAPYIYVNRIESESYLGYRPEFRILNQMLGYPEFFDATDPKIRLMMAISIITIQYHQNQQRMKIEKNGA